MVAQIPLRRGGSALLPVVAPIAPFISESIRKIIIVAIFRRCIAAWADYRIDEPDNDEADSGEQCVTDGELHLDYFTYNNTRRRASFHFSLPRNPDLPFSSLQAPCL